MVGLVPGHGDRPIGNRVPYPRHPVNDSIRQGPPPVPPRGGSGGGGGGGNDPLGCMVPAAGLALAGLAVTIATAIGAHHVWTWIA